MANFKLACVVLMCIAMLYAQNGYAVTCGQVTSNILPCVAYLQNNDPLTAHCCNGVKAIFNAASRTTVDLRTTCYCLKSVATAANNYKRLNKNNVVSLPGKCGLNLPFKIGPSIDCASITW